MLAERIFARDKDEMRNIIVSGLMIMGLLFATGSVFAGEEERSEPGAQIGSQWDPPPEPLAESGKGPRYDRRMRDLDQEYQRGALTKTEYIQRKRLIEAEEK